MGTRTVGWLVNTCLLGMIPVIARLLVWLISQRGVEPLAISDLVTFGLVLHSANVNEVNRPDNQDQSWKIVHNGLSALFIVVYSILLFATVSTTNINQSAVLYTTIVLAFISFLLSLSIQTRDSSGVLEEPV